jgi:hypothetical protein
MSADPLRAAHTCGRPIQRCDSGKSQPYVSAAANLGSGDIGLLLRASSRLAIEDQNLAQSYQQRCNESFPHDHSRHLPGSVVEGPPDASLFGVMENDPKRVSQPHTNSAYTMTHFDSIGSPESLSRPVIHGKHHRITLPQRHHFSS